MRLAEDKFASCLESIKANAPSSMFVDFSFDNLENEHLQQLLSALATNTVCHSLNLNVNNLDNAACELIANYIARDPAIQNLELSGNNLDTDAAILILQALCFNTRLEFLALQDNSIDDDAIPHLRQLQKINHTLKKIDLRFNKFSLNGMLILTESTLSHNKVYTNSYNLREGNADYILHRRMLRFFQLTNRACCLIEQFNIDQTYSLVDLIQYSIMHSFEQKMTIEDFFRQCIILIDTRKKIVSTIVSSPPGDERDELLRSLGHCLFFNIFDNNQEAILSKIYAHICFVAITTQHAEDKTLLVENYRSLVCDLGIIHNRNFREWKNNYVKTMPYPIIKIADKLIAEVFSLLARQDSANTDSSKNVTKSLDILHTFKNKVLMQRELIAEHRVRYMPMQVPALFLA